MTKESDANEDTVRQHKLPWLSTSRSCFSVISSIFTEFNKLVKKLDKRAQESTKAGGFKSKTRLISLPSTLLPPPDAPRWCVTENCLQNASVPTSHLEATTPLSVTPRGVELSDMSTPSHSSSVIIHDHSVNVTTPIASSGTSRQSRLDFSSPVVQHSPVSIDDNSTTIITPLASSSSSNSNVLQQISESSDSSSSLSSD